MAGKSFLQDRTVVAGDLRADFDVRVAGGHRIEAGAYPFLLIAVASEGRPRSDHIPHRDGDVVQYGAQLALAGEPAELDVAVRLLFGGHPRGQARRAQQRREPAHPPEQLPDPLFHGLVEPVVRVRAVDQDRAQGTVGIPAGPVRRDDRPVGPAHQQRPVHIPGRENGIDIPDGGHEGIVRRTLRFPAAGPLVVGDVPPPRPQFSDDPPPVPLSGELAIEVDHRDTGTAGVGDGQGRIVNRHHAGPLRIGRGSAVLRHCSTWSCSSCTASPGPAWIAGPFGTDGRVVGDDRRIPVRPSVLVCSFRGCGR